jgi:tetratricopeptide (TPR) repeat protein
MGDSTEASHGRIDLTGGPPANGDRLGLERVIRPAIPKFDWTDDPQAQHTSALIKLGELKQAKGLNAEAEALFREALDIGEQVLRPDDARLLPALSSVACACIARGALAEAEPMVTRLLAMSESNRGQDHPDLVIILNDITRVCLRQSAATMAESVLLRLAAIKRAKGEDHPEVATVLASLAAVRQALGRHESAEQLWRRVLSIRERTLAPNHFTLATTLEHFGEACAARGKIGESLQAYRRAQAIRELTLGADHASVRASRERIADLQLQGSEDSLDSEDVSPGVSRGVSLPDGFSLPSSANLGAAPSALPTRDSSTARRNRRGARVLDRPGLEKPTTEVGATVAEPVPAPIREIALPISAAIPYADLYQSPRQDTEYSDEDAEEIHPIKGFLAWCIHILRRRRTTALAMTGVAAVFIGVVTTDSRAWSDAEESVAEPVPVRQETTLPGGPLPATRPTLGAIDRSDRAPEPTALADIAPPTARPRAAEQRTPARNDSERRTAPAISIPTIPSTLMASFDSALRAQPIPTGGIGETPVMPAPIVGGGSGGLTFERYDPVNSHQPARLIGTLPTPRASNAVRDVHGDVLVRFEVDSSGRPVVSSFSVVNSPNQILSAAVLRVIPGLRFEPARSGGAEPKPVPDVVQLKFQFRPTK